MKETFRIKAKSIIISGVGIMMVLYLEAIN